MTELPVGAAPRTIGRPVVLAEAGFVNHVLIVTHGIRTYGNWMDRLAATLNEELSPAKGGTRRAIHVWKFRYGRFSLPAFLVPGWLRDKIVAKFNDAYEAAKRAYPGARVSFIAHSFGTYVVARALQRYPSISLRYVIFCGGLAPKRYGWEQLFRDGRVEKVVNECCLRDVLPVLARLLVVGMDSSGVFGFVDTPERAERFKNRPFAAYGHGGCFHEGHYREFWAPIFRGEEIADGPDRGARPPLLFRVLELIPRPVAKALALAAVAVLSLQATDRCLPWLELRIARLIEQAENTRRPDDAEVLFKQSETVCPSAVAPKVALGRYYFRNERYDQARAAFDMAFDLGGRQDPIVARMLANALVGARKFDLAANKLHEAERLHLLQIGSDRWDELRRQLTFFKGSLHLIVLLRESVQGRWSATDYEGAIGSMRSYLEHGGRPIPWAHYSIACARAVRLQSDPLAQADQRALRETILAELEQAVNSLHDWLRKEPDKARPSPGLLLERLRNQQGLRGAPLLPEPCSAIAGALSGREPSFAMLLGRLEMLAAGR